MSDFRNSYNALCLAVADYENATGTSVNDIKGFVESYPFDKSLDELAIDQWVGHTTESFSGVKFKVLNYEYMNTGGNCMVGIFQVWLPDENRTIYALTNEEGCTLATVDYISNELEIDDYDELMIDYVDWGRVTGYEKYFELYRHCLNQYLKDDCKYFAVSRGVPFHLLSDELQKTVDVDYLAWLEAEGDGLVETNGYTTFEDAHYMPVIEDTNDKPIADTASTLQAIKDFKLWHDMLTEVDNREKMHEHNYVIFLDGNNIRIPFNADSWSAIDKLLKTALEDY